MKSKSFWFLAATIFIAVVVVALFQWGLKHTGISNSAPSGHADNTAEHHEDPSHENEGFVYLADDQLKQFGIETQAAGAGKLEIEVILPGELVLDADRVAHVVPRVSGVVREVRKNLGDPVRENEVMAVVESRELADTIAALLAARERLNLAQSNFEREEKVWLRKISPEQDYIEAKNRLAEARIELHAAEHKLLALGFSDDFLSRLSEQSEKTPILYEITAPFEATVIEKHISLGEVLSSEDAVFIVADLRSVWGNLDVQQKDLSLIRVGQKATIEVPNSNIRGEGRIDFIEPLATSTNRTVHARVVLPNNNGRFRPGLFVNGRISVGDLEVPLLVPNESLLLMEGDMCVFVREGEGFRLRPVNIGRSNEKYSEIVSGLSPGEEYVSREPFILKMELGKPEAEH
jgi:cobalt-zinc-cadmium efflux system membrane fusion protein